MALNYIIGLDIGTSSVKGVLVAEDGTEKTTGKAEFVYTYREDGGIEIDAEAYLDACFSLLRRLASGPAEHGALRGISAASASGNLLLLDEAGRPSTPIFNWQDSRVGEEARTVLGRIDAGALYGQTGWPFDYKTFPLAMLCWIKCHRPELLEHASKVCMSTEYLVYRLTGRWGVSTSAGSPFYLLDQRTGEYNRELLGLFGIGEEQLPPVGRAGDAVGAVTKEGAARSGLPEGVPVLLGTFDHPSAARGAGVLQEGQMLLSCGTSWVGFFPLRDRQKGIANRMIVDPFLSPEGCWAGMVSIPSISPRIERYIRRYIDDSDGRFRAFAAEAAGAGRARGDWCSTPWRSPTTEPSAALPSRILPGLSWRGRCACSGINSGSWRQTASPPDRPSWWAAHRKTRSGSG